MDSDRVGQGEFVQLAELINDLTRRKTHCDLALHRINLHNLPDVAVEYLFVIVILGLDHLVVEAELPAELLHRRFVRPCGIQFRLQARVQFTDAKGAPIHWREHLDVADGIELEFVWNAALEQIEEHGRNSLGLLPLYEIEILVGVPGWQFWQEPLVDPMRIGDDPAAGSLPEHLRQPCYRHDAAFDQVAQHQPRAHRRQLVNIAYQQQVALGGHSPQEMAHQRHKNDRLDGHIEELRRFSDDAGNATPGQHQRISE